MDKKPKIDPPSKSNWLKQLLNSKNSILMIEIVVLVVLLIMAGFSTYLNASNNHKINQPQVLVPHKVTKASPSPVPTPSATPTPRPACVSITPDSYPWTYGNSTDCSFTHAAGNFFVAYTTSGYNITEPSNNYQDPSSWYPKIICSP